MNKNNKNNKNRRRNGGGTGPRTNNARPYLDIRTSGRSFVPPIDPPSLSAMPWSGITVDQSIALPGSGSAAVITTGTSLIGALANQLNISSSNLQVRCKSFSAWLVNPIVTASTAPTGLVAVPYSDYESATQNQLQVLHDFPSPLHFARVGFVFPEKNQTFTFDNADTGVFIVGFNTDTTTAGIAYVQFNCEWRPLSSGV
jgi:hypothetical protein